MKIKLTLSEKQLTALVGTFEILLHPPINVRRIRVARSVLDKVVLKFQKKQLEVKLSADLFNSKKKYSFSFEYHEAHYLEEFIAVVQQFDNDTYTLNVLLQLQLILNRQLI